ncbi:MAG: hypothetical protein LBR79_03960 [Oscillospiraceae bacterium]|nr:hypothetical protein [Oscillospiraceae bacterium]
MGKKVPIILRHDLKKACSFVHSSHADARGKSYKSLYFLDSGPNQLIISLPMASGEKSSNYFETRPLFKLNHCKSDKIAKN